MTNLYKNIKLVIKGFLIGASAITPGLSSGTVAILLGIYNDLIENLNTVIYFRKEHFFKSFFYVLFISTGVVISFIFIADFIDQVYDKYPSQLNIFFVGLITGTIHMISKKIIKKKLKKHSFFSLTLIFIFFYSLVLVINFLSLEKFYLANADNFIVRAITIVTSGFLGSFSAIIPGLSGSMILVFIGTYNTIIEALVSNDWIILFMFMLGGFVGFLICIKIIKYAIMNYIQKLNVAILGLMFGSVTVILSFIPLVDLNILSLFLFLFGFIFIFLTERNKKNN